MIDFFERLDIFMKHKGLNDNKITIETGISNGLIGKGRKRGSISQENISKILHAYPEINANWLLTGEGEMVKSDSLAQSVSSAGSNVTVSRETWEMIKLQIQTINNQQQTIQSQQQAIEFLTKKGDIAANVQIANAG